MHCAMKAAVTSGVLGLAAALMSPLSASAATVEAQWTMSVSPGSPTLTQDKGGDSTIALQGDYSSVGGAVGDAVSFGYSGRAALGTAEPSDRFNPGSTAFAVAAYFRTGTVPVTGNYSPNIVQKGSYRSTDQWKMQLKGTTSGTVAECRFAGSSLPAGDIVEDQSQTRLDDSRWHEVVCWRSDARYGVTVDGVNTSRQGDLGAISTPQPLRIANKGPRAGIQDQLQGVLDCVAYVDGSTVRAQAESAAPC
jgi:hypothetical protein